MSELIPVSSIGRAAALGVTTATADGLLGTAALAAGPKKGGTLSMGLGGGQSTDSLDPALAASQVPILYAMTMGDRLADISPSGKVVNRLAETIESTPDAKVWSFAIRKGVEFHNGRTLTPQDVLKTIQRHADKKSKSGAFGLLQGIDSMRVDGERFEVTLSTPNADFPFLVAGFHLEIQPDGGMDQPDAGVFAGPYKLKAFRPGVRLTLEKFENYWDSGIGHFAEIDILVINDSTARNSALRAGQVQMINLVEPRVANFLKRTAEVIVAPTSGRGMNVFNMFCDTPPFDNNDLRMALKLAIDREALLAKVLAGYGSLGNDMPVNAAYPLFDTTIPQRSYDPDKAAYHYKKSGHSGSILLRTADTAFPGAVDAASLFQQSAKKAGINIEIKREPNDGYWTEVWNAKPFSASFWDGRPTQDLMYSIAYLSDASWNDTHFRRADFDKIILQARGELDQAKRKELYREAGLMIRDTGGLINPMFNQFIDAYDHTKIAGWVPNPNQDMMNGLAGVLFWQA